MGNPLWLPLARAGTLVDEVRSADDLPLHAGFMSDLPKDHALSRFLAAFDLIISWFGDREGRWEKTLRGACAGRLLVHPYHRVHAFEGHVSDFYLTTLKESALRVQDRIGQEQPPAPLLQGPRFSGIAPEWGRPGRGGSVPLPSSGKRLCAKELAERGLPGGGQRSLPPLALALHRADRPGRTGPEGILDRSGRPLPLRERRVTDPGGGPNAPQGDPLRGQ